MLVEGHDVEKTGMSLDEMVSKEGKDSDGDSYTPLRMAAIMNSWRSSSTSSRVVLQWTSLDRRIVLAVIVYIVLHGNQRRMFKYSNGSLIITMETSNRSSIIRRISMDKHLDYAYEYNHSHIRNDIVSLLRKYGGKGNYYDKNGNKVGKGKGDLND